MSQRIIALLGRRDDPTDAVEEYCTYLGDALGQYGFDLELVRVPWAEKGWRAALGELQERSTAWRGAWVLLQYTALSWSRRGVPYGALRAFRAVGPLEKSGVRFGVVFHDARTYPGTRAIDVLRRYAQKKVMRRLFAAAEKVILTVPAEKIGWLPADPGKAVFIPVGANLSPTAQCAGQATKQRGALVVAVFGVTGGDGISREAHDIAFAVNHAAEHAGRIQLVVLGRNALASQEFLRPELDASRIELHALGVLPAAEVAEILAQADVLLFVRGGISSRRGSALAGIACGLPVVAYRGAETAAPVTEAGVLLADEGDCKGLADALERVLTDAQLRENLRERSCAAQEKYFSWKAIAALYASTLRSGN
jgi:glycosyltransferase involved in cell wall biosynthesis